MQEKIVKRDNLSMLYDCVSLIMVLVHIAVFTFYPIKSGVLYGLHLMFGLAIIFLGRMVKKEGNNLIYILALLITIVINIYVIIDYDSFAMRIQVFPNQIDLIMGVLATIVVLYATYKTTGWGLTTIVGISILYALVGKNLPGVFGHGGYSVKRIFTTIFSEQGIYGTALGVSATNVFLFLLFASFLGVSGADEIFQDLSIALAGKKRGGPAKIAVMSSAFFGSISGSAVANVVSTGSFTIPMMIKRGYSKKFAGAVEAVSSTGGQIMPPIMGAAAFILADAAGTPYNQVAIAALIPALMYYFSLFIMVDIESIKTGQSGLPKSELPDLKEVSKKSMKLFIPLGVLLFFLLIVKSTPMKAAIYSIVSIIVISLFDKESRINLNQLIAASRDTGSAAQQVIAACSASGIVVAMLSLTGLGLKLSNLIVNIAGGNLLGSLIAAMVVCMILGMGLPTTAAYIIASSSVAPALIGIGVAPLAAHLFILYYACVSAITPPVAVASYAAAGLADENPMKVGWEAVRLGIVAYIVPFAFVLNEKLLIVITGFSGEVFIDLIFAALTCLAIAFSMQGWLFGKINIIIRALILGLALLMLSANNLICLIAGLIFVSLILINKMKDSSGNKNEQMGGTVL